MPVLKTMPVKPENRENVYSGVGIFRLPSQFPPLMQIGLPWQFSMIACLSSPTDRFSVCCYHNSLIKLTDSQHALLPRQLRFKQTDEQLNPSGRSLHVLHRNADRQTLGRPFPFHLLYSFCYDLKSEKGKPNANCPLH